MKESVWEYFRRLFEMNPNNGRMDDYEESGDIMGYIRPGEKLTKYNDDNDSKNETQS